MGGNGRILQLASSNKNNNELLMRLLVLSLLLSVSVPAFAADSGELQNRLDNTVTPFVGKYCVSCHSGTQPTGQFDLKSYTSMDQVKEDFPRWSLLAELMEQALSRGVNRDSGMASANGGWLRRLVRHHGSKYGMK